tara:strand:- start:936 stop:1838 length:903 start_codon:yes stop_codon:yes gene_type:complete
MNENIKNIAVIGLGLIGSSILHALKLNFKNKFYITAYDINSKNRKVVRELKIADKVCEKIAVSVQNADLIFLSVPVGVVGEVAKNISPFLKKGAIVTDTGSTKLSVIRDVKPFFSKNICFIPSHPLAGTEHSGPESGFASLFKNRYWIIIGEKNDQNVKKLDRILSKIGAYVELMDADYHDRILAITSHLPHLIAFTIVGTASDLEMDIKNDVIRFSATGFRDFTRLASSDPTMWRDVFINNTDSVLEMLQRFNEDLTELQKLIRKKDSSKLYDFFSRTKRIRSQIIEAGQHEPEYKKKK